MRHRSFENEGRHMWGLSSTSGDIARWSLSSFPPFTLLIPFRQRPAGIVSSRLHLLAFLCIASRFITLVELFYCTGKDYMAMYCFPAFICTTDFVMPCISWRHLPNVTLRYLLPVNRAHRFGCLLSQVMDAWYFFCFFVSLYGLL